MYEFFKGSGKGEPERLHEYEERRTQRRRFSESFEAGSIRGELLSDALGFNTADDNEGKGRELPWLWHMLEWGYPPGWVSEEDPKLKVLARIEGESVWTDDLDATIVFDNLPPPTVKHLSVPTENGADHAETHRTRTIEEATNTRKRWVHYPTRLFSSEHLAVYSGVPLPPLTHAGSLSMATRGDQDNDIPPWRLPGAFSAFGPAGWQEYIKQDNISVQARRRDSSAQADCNDDVEKSDMDLSE
ncbi:hypothetical protein JB92DRAFT_1063337 [Gautieria morchelliformis]|nr:hypothetical protein JB92DRAFT_1063337 [Gautieria morchelliformis]